MRIRFLTARDVYENFPTLASDVVAQPMDVPPMEFLRLLGESDTPEDAITFFAYLAPKRDAVFWSCRCIQRMAVPLQAPEAIEAAMRWVENPEEDVRRATLAIAEASPSEAAETWVAYGAGWAGGNIAPAGAPPVPASPHLTPKSCRAAVLIAVAHVPPRGRREQIGLCLEEAVAVAGGSDGSR
jgi:hypothetical protein